MNNKRIEEIRTQKEFPYRDPEKVIEEYGDMASSILSPCIGICSFCHESGICCGCTRTKEEATSWRNLKDQELLDKVKEIEKRQNELFGN